MMMKLRWEVRESGAYNYCKERKYAGKSSGPLVEARKETHLKRPSPSPGSPSHLLDPRLQGSRKGHLLGPHLRTA